jgi:hypothetical protein
VATAFNVIRLLALGLAVGLVTRAEQTGADPLAQVTEREGLP